jgi:prepilin-type processing-associated H-X9-DG protein
MTCTNNLKQLGIALHNYHDTNKAFPAASSRLFKKNSSGTLTSHYSFLGTMFILTPYYELSSVYEEGKNNPIDPTNGTPWAKTQSTLICPSDANKNLTQGRSDYVVCTGDLPDILVNDSIKNTRGLFVMPDVHWAVCDGVYMTLTNPTGRNLWRSFASLNDGTSNTIAFSERVTAAKENNFRGAYSIAATNGIDATIAATFPYKCSLMKQSNGTYSGATQTDYLGTRWGDGRMPSTFSAVLPPNSASCSGNGATFGIFQDRSIFTATSYHANGVNVTFADGSTHFITNTIDSGNINDTTTPVTFGSSPFGVWGALGSIDGGETVELP